MAGSMCTAILGGLLSNGIGRRRTILIASPMIALAWVLMACALNRNMVYLARLLMGIFTGLSYGSTGGCRHI